MSGKPRISTTERAGLDPKERKRRAKIAKEKISLRLEGTEIYKFVKRINLTLKDINHVFDCDAWYAKDEASGDVIWPEKWSTTMQPSTDASHWRYVIVERDKFPRFDQTKDSSVYDGDAVIWCENVPYECEAATLVCWIRAGLETTLPHIRKAAHRENELLKFFEQANAELNDCNKQPVEDEEEMEYKARRAEFLKEAADVAEARFQRAKGLHAEAIAALRSEPIIAIPVIRDPSQSKALWQIDFSRADRANMVMLSIDDSIWNAIRVSQPEDYPPYCLLPIDGEADPRTNFDDEIEMRGSAFKRFRHGEGRERKISLVGGGGGEKPGRANVNVQYKGGFQYGARHGVETETITYYYTLLGDYYQGTPTVAHELLFANGDRYQGDVAATYANGHPAKDVSTAFTEGSDKIYEDSRYDSQPIPNGEGTMYFADGSTYVGHFVNGRATGLGKYVGCSGEMLEGNFEDGVLSGTGRKDYSGVHEVGTFRDGSLHGRGLKLFQDRYLHEGTFENGELNKYGCFETPKLRYRGWIEHNCPSDHGVCEFGEQRRVFNESTRQMVDTPQYACEGGWLGGRPIGKQSVVRERIFKKAKDVAAQVKKDASAKPGALKGKRHIARESLAYQFAFQCKGARALARRLRRESERPTGVAAALHLSHLEMRRKHLKTVPSRQLKFLQNVSKILQEPEFDDFMGVDQNYGPDEEPGDPIKEEIVVQEDVMVS